MEHHGLRVLQSLPELIKKQNNSGYPVEILVYDSHLPWALDMAKKLGLKGASFFTQCCVVSAIHRHMHKGTLEIPMERSLVSIPSMPLMDINWILFNTFEELEDEVVKWLSSQWPILTIGPSIPSIFLDKRLSNDKDYGLSLFKPDGEACIKWLDTKDTSSVVYVSFGSLAILDEAHMAEIAWGLCNSNCNFLWVVRDAEKSKLPSNFLNEASEKRLVVSWCPQLEVLAHKAVGSFMTHCGWNSTIEALSLGVPMLAMPQWTDQTTNAKYVVDVWKTGVRVKPFNKERVTSEEIAECVKVVMEGAKGKELRGNALRWKELAVEAMCEGGSSDKNINEFISKIVSTAS